MHPLKAFYQMVSQVCGFPSTQTKVEGPEVQGVTQCRLDSMW